MIGIAGIGVIGSEMLAYAEEKAPQEVLAYDIDETRGYRDDLSLCEIVFICVPAPTTHDQKIDLSAIEDVLTKFKGKNGKPSPVFFLRSTVPPGTTDMLAEKHGVTMYAMPEFLSMKTARADLREMPVIVGCPPGVLPTLFLDLFGEHAIYTVTNRTAELAKYAHNVFGALKITYFNMIRSLAGEHADYEMIRDFLIETKHVDRTYTEVPGHDNKFGYGGACFPKDTAAFFGFLKEQGLGHEALFIDCVITLNDHYRSRSVE